jgi:hypothetical protein
MSYLVQIMAVGIASGSSFDSSLLFEKKKINEKKPYLNKLI